MRDVSNTTGFDGYGETSWEAGDSSTTSPGKTFYQELIAKANTVSLISIFRHYGLRIDERHHTVVCPFKSHKGGRESTASFWYYSHTNSFFCFGCRVGGEFAHGCEFIAAMDGISKVKAAHKIFELFRDEISDDEMFDIPDSAETLEIMMDFSNTVREFRQSHFDEKSFIFIEKVCLVYDKMHRRHKTLDNEALRRLVEQLKEKITSYKPCPTL